MFPGKSPLRVNPASSATSGLSPLSRSGWGSGLASILSPSSNDTPPPVALPAVPSHRPPAACDAPSEPKDKIYAQRFRTKLCRNYEEKGTCPYENRCMFAHGESQLRTTEINISEGILSTQAINEFKAKHPEPNAEPDSDPSRALAARKAERRPQEGAGTPRVLVAAEHADRRSVPPRIRQDSPNLAPIVLDAQISPARSASSDRQPSRSSESSDGLEMTLPPAWNLRSDPSLASFGDETSNASLTAPCTSVASSSLLSVSSTDIGGTRQSFRWNPYRWTPIVPQDGDPDTA